MTPQGNGPSYGVHMSQQTKMHVRKMHLDAAQLGKGIEFVAAFRQIIDRLRTEPWLFGEPAFTLPALKLQIRKAIIGRLVVDYAIHEERPLVFIRGFKLLS